MTVIAFKVAIRLPTSKHIFLHKTWTKNSEIKTTYRLPFLKLYDNLFHPDEK